MTHGLLIKDAQGRTIIGPDTFTVRMIDQKISGVGMMKPGSSSRINMSSKVRSGMFAIVMPLKQYSIGYVAPYDTYRANPLPVCLPYVTVHDGYVVLRADGMRDARIDGNVAIYVFTNV